jgi:hypothetical protein
VSIHELAGPQSMAGEADLHRSGNFRHRLQGAAPAALTLGGVAFVWGASVLLHGATLGGIAVWGSGNAVGRGQPRPLEVGLVLRGDAQQTSLFDSPDAQAAEPQPGMDVGDPRANSMEQPPNERLSEVLPDSVVDRRLLATAGNALREAQQTTAPSQRLDGGKARTKFFDVDAVGKSFIWVIDRSASMSHRFALELAKREVEKSLASLGPQQHFQMFFYHTHFDKLPGAGGALMPATPEHVASARKFIRQMVPQGGTEHIGPLLEAIRLSPDVIYFLTDADMMSDRDVAELTGANRRLRRPASIHAIEFGNGPNLNDDKPLRRLARENEGTYFYVDVQQTTIPRASQKP